MNPCSNHEYDENCPGCQPVLFDIKKQQPMDEKEPVMAVVLAAFKACSMIQKRAWHRVVVGMSQNEKDKQIMIEVSQVIQKAMTEFEESQQ